MSGFSIFGDEGGCCPVAGLAHRAAPRPGDSPASLSMSHISNEQTEKLNQLTGSHRRMAHVLSVEIQGLANEFGINQLGFLTLTFADRFGRRDLREAQRRFNSLNTGVLRSRYSRVIGVWERSDAGHIHFHLVVVLASDIRSGFDFKGVKLQDYSSA